MVHDFMGVSVDVNALLELALAVLLGSGAGLYARHKFKKGKHFSAVQLQEFADGMRRELFERAGASDKWVDMTDYLKEQPYYPGHWFLATYRILFKSGIVATPNPRMQRGGGFRMQLSPKGIEEARMERLMAAAEEPRTVRNYQAGVIQIGDQNQASHVNAHFGADPSPLLGQLVTALVTVSRNTTVQPQLREAAEQAAADLQTADESRLPLILERVRGIASVAATGFEAVRPILDAITG
ncbi:hypothetical protein [Streptomyces puniciscabiei]|uniref:hypothetical protein n=1 Tax=Streptomyces puniciscabiei TaxID=164348 RepID=UPI00331D5777